LAMSTTDEYSEDSNEMYLGELGGTLSQSLRVLVRLG